MALTARRQRFVDEYLKDLNATQAAIRAGYSENGAKQTAARLLTFVDVAAAIKAEQDKRSIRNRISADWVLKRLIKNVQRASVAIPVLDYDGEPIGEYRYEGNVVNKALELIGKHIGMFTDKMELSGPGGVPLQMSEIVIVHHKPPAAIEDSANRVDTSAIGEDSAPS